MAGEEATGRGLRDITFHLISLLVIATLGPLQFGFHLAELNAPQDVITCKKNSIASLVRLAARALDEDNGGRSWVPACIPMNEAAFAFVSSAFTVGGLLGALSAGDVSSKRGRLPAMRLTALLFALGSLVETVAGSVAVFSLGRFLAGIGAGAATVVVPLYISEVAPPDRRGLFGVMTQVSINVGILAAQVLGYFFSHGGAWRVILGAAACLSVAQALGLLLAVPESPAWVAAHRGDAAGARRILQKIRGRKVDIESETSAWGGAGVAGEAQGLLSQSEEGMVSGAATAPNHLGFLQVVKDPLYRPAIVAVVGASFAQQFCGINSIIMYSVSLLQDLLPISSVLLTILVSVVNLAMTIACSPLPDRIGRKTCLMISVIGQGCSSLALALSIVSGLQILSAFAVVFFVAFFAVGLGPVPFILASELVGQEAVGAAQSWALAGAYVSTFMVAQFFPILNTALNKAFGGHGGWVYFVFAAVAAGAALFIAWRIPESQGKKDADEVWGRTRRLD
ncbi:General substrate transporter [Cordyceps fumosorosea ARSEF 2679]|uniref:General substrate transporter n=1 Tax=Cordyceps fumosorosea (strain ARSEF 2679) TaxID=1081104 RepID=A0A167PNB7_CORFA|nr:General substrate transporter [Cordyceps fumosorosea ARSEF 2679]OAA56848.1 General substrate transporter [Cordyceps fumosorosea ARSEF 2679]